MVRDPGQPTARELADQGVEVVAGSLSDRGSLAAAMSGGRVYAPSANLPFPKIALWSSSNPAGSVVAPRWRHRPRRWNRGRLYGTHHLAPHMIDRTSPRCPEAYELWHCTPSLIQPGSDEDLRQGGLSTSQASSTAGPAAACTSMHRHYRRRLSAHPGRQGPPPEPRRRQELGHRPRRIRPPVQQAGLRRCRAVPVPRLHQAQRPHRNRPGGTVQRSAWLGCRSVAPRRRNVTRRDTRRRSSTHLILRSEP
ncbi:NmrA family NAD(P)-binding protein [Streptomyces lydicus]|uniref:NmrA family NAD(P)-binding protein n=1 Tax=Streptomyces lydicus TaxID=47763 RepID=UPI0037153E87